MIMMVIMIMIMTMIIDSASPSAALVPGSSSALALLGSSHHAQPHLAASDHQAGADVSKMRAGK